MCGIFGIYQPRPDALFDTAKIRRSIDLLAHRGPDGHNYTTSPGMVMGHTRLAMVDPSPTSQQPFWDCTQRYALTFNGEIYNFRSLRSQLSKAGVLFRTRGDTEVLMHALIQWGVEQAVSRIEGMFAFALYDSHTHQLTMVRDRLGIKPLFTASLGDTVLFASDVRAFTPWLTLKPDMLSVLNYLHGYSRISSRHTYFRNVKSLEPGGMLKIGKRLPPQFTRLQAPEDLRTPQLMQLGKRQAIDRLEELLLSSVEQQLASDAKVGVFCSGGVDSSLILAMAKRFDSDVQAFHANVAGEASELAAAKSVAAQLDVQLQTVDVMDHHFVESLTEKIYHLGRPFSHQPHAIPLAAVCRLASQAGCKAVLCGEGADELFVGYRNVIPSAWQLLSARILGPLRRKTRLPFSPSKKRPSSSPNLFHLLDNLLRAEPSSRTSQLSIDSDSFQTPTTSSFAPPWCSLALLGRSLPELLERNDTFGMAVGLEARYPVLDTRILELAINVPLHYKLQLRLTARGTQRRCVSDKWLLRQVAKRYLPSAICTRRKRPFPTTAFQRLRIDRKCFDDSALSDLLELSRSEVRGVLENANHRLLLRLLHLEIWAKLFLVQEPTERVADQIARSTSVAA